MRGLFTKIFLGFWIAQSLTFFISTMLILQHRFFRPSDVMEVLDATLPSAVAAAVNAYESGGCAGLQRFAGSLHQTIYLADSPTNLFCGAEISPAAQAELATSNRDTGVHLKLVGDDYLWSTAIQSATGRRYLFLLSRHRTANTYGLRDLLHFAFPQLPVAIVVFGLTTFVLVLLLVRPIERLRVAARSLANGELSTRVAKPDGEERFFGGDEIQGLVHDFNFMAEQLGRRTEVVAARCLSRIAITPRSSERCPGIGARRSACSHDVAFAAYRARSCATELVDWAAASFVLHGINQRLRPNG
jgi:two-component system sensor histidine kinase CpxA